MKLSNFLKNYIKKNLNEEIEIKIFKAFKKSLESIPKQLLYNNQLIVFNGQVLKVRIALQKSLEYRAKNQDC